MLRKSRTFTGISILFVLFIAFAVHSNSAGVHASNSHHSKTELLTVDERIYYQELIDRIYYDLLLWDEEKSGPKPPFEQEIPDTIIQNKVNDYLLQSNALKYLWGFEITGEMLQSELDRICVNTLRPDVLLRLFSKLNNDPRIIAECLVRPILAHNMLKEQYIRDERIHGSLYERARLVVQSKNLVWNELPDDIIYAENEWVLTKNPDEVAGNDPEPIDGLTYLDQASWQRLENELVKRFNVSEGESVLRQGLISPLQEDNDSVYVEKIMKATSQKIKIARIVWEKQPFELWWIQNRDSFHSMIDEPLWQYRLPSLGENSKQGGDFWLSITTTGAPSARSQHKAIWNGSYMVIWGGWNGSSYYQSGGRYDPTTDSWLSTALTNAPDGRRLFTVINQSDEMWVWGGYGGASFNTGGRYDSLTNSWQNICSTPAPDPCNAPTARYLHAAIDYGRYLPMTIWGGHSGSNDLKSGADYASADAWFDTDESDPDCPSARQRHTAVLTHGPSSDWYMVIWGGDDRLDSGGRMRLTGDLSDPWLPVESLDAPPGRHNHEAIAIFGDYTFDDLMMVWGGYTWGADLWSNQGGLYSPYYNDWTLTSTVNAQDGRQNLSMIKNTHEIIVWGGDQTSSCTNTGGRYNVDDDSWLRTTIVDTDVPSARTDHSAVWVGNGMIVWGGYDLVNRTNTGALYVSCWRTPQAGSSGNLTATDEPCDYSCIELSWDQDVDTWGDFGNSTSREYYVLRNGTTLLAGGCSGTFPYGTTTCTDDIAAPDVTYSYTLVYVNACGQEGSSSSTAVISDTGSTAPLVSVTCSVQDTDGCTPDSGITVSWPQDPGGSWGDNGVGDRKYRVWRMDNIYGTWDALGSQVDYGITTYQDDTAQSGFIYWYRVKYINGCSDNDDTASSNSVMDLAGITPSVSQVIQASDLDDCAVSGIEITWPLDADDWGDNESGDRYYRVRRSTDGITFNPIGDNIAYGTTSYIDTGANPDQLYYYQVRYKNGCDLNADTANETATELSVSAPTVTVNSDSTDTDKCADAGIYITWDSTPTEWGDNGSGTRTYDILRDGIELVTGLSSGTDNYTDITGTNGVSYLYQVRYNNGCGLSTTTIGTTSNDRPFVPGPLQNNTAVDLDDCDQTGIQINWNIDPTGNWGDGSEGSRTYDILRDSIPIQTGITYGITTFDDTTGVANQTYNYTIRYVNGCGLSSETSPGVDVADIVDITSCPDIGDSLLLTKSGTDVTLTWADIGCGDLNHYRVYVHTDASAPFPVQWPTLSTPIENIASDTTGSSWAFYKISSIDTCDNENFD